MNKWEKLSKINGLMDKWKYEGKDPDETLKKIEEVFSR